MVGAGVTPFVWTAFFACWLLKLFRQTQVHEVNGAAKVSLSGPSELVGGELMAEPGSGETVVQGKYGFNQTLLLVMGCALALKLVLMQMGCRGWISFSLVAYCGALV